MRLPVKLVAYVGDPVAGFDDNGEGTVEMPEGATLAELLAKLDVAGAELSLALVNDDTVRQKDQAARVLQPGDRITVFPPIKGG